MSSDSPGTMPEDFIASIDREERCLQINRSLQHIPSAFSVQSRDFSFQIQMLHFTFDAQVMETGNHSHRFYELAFPLRDMRYRISPKNRITEADSGLLLIPPGEIHDRIAERKNALCFGMVFDLQSDHPEKMEGFLRSLRQKGYKMEISSGDPVKQIAGHCTFNNMSYFARSFYRFYNNTPAYYRLHG